jgi:poly(A) polymerase
VTAGASIAGQAPWLEQPALQDLLKLLSEGGEEARIAGGAVRNALLGEPVTDIDIATTTEPQETLRRVGAAGLRAVPTGIEHGTVTVIAAGAPYEVTTLRSDIETDGRHARVAFGRDWRRDAERRDFTINGLYADADGAVLDLVGGLEDIRNRRLRFIGDPETRIREDFLRILRFFRFFAQYGSGRPDADGLRACARLKEGLLRLSAERVWSELKKLLGAADPARALLWMRQASVLSTILPESEKWGIDAIHALVAAEQAAGWAPDPLLRLAAIVPPDAGRLSLMAERLKLSKAEAARLLGWAGTEAVAADIEEDAFARRLYRADIAGLRDRLRLAQAAAQARDPVEGARAYAQLLSILEQWQRPVFPVRGGDLAELGLAGPQLGAALRDLEERWMESGFSLDRETLLDRVTGRRSD